MKSVSFRPSDFYRFFCFGKWCQISKRYEIHNSIEFLKIYFQSMDLPAAKYTRPCTRTQTWHFMEFVLFFLLLLLLKIHLRMNDQQQINLLTKSEIFTEILYIKKKDMTGACYFARNNIISGGKVCTTK